MIWIFKHSRSVKKEIHFLSSVNIDFKVKNHYISWIEQTKNGVHNLVSKNAIISSMIWSQFNQLLNDAELLKRAVTNLTYQNVFKVSRIGRVIWLKIRTQHIVSGAELAVPWPSETNPLRSGVIYHQSSTKRSSFSLIGNRGIWR